MQNVVFFSMAWATCAMGYVAWPKPLLKRWSDATINDIIAMIGLVQLPLLLTMLALTT